MLRAALARSIFFVGRISGCREPIAGWKTSHVLGNAFIYRDRQIEPVLIEFSDLDCKAEGILPIAQKVGIS